jgi:hypothetical protein
MATSKEVTELLEQTLAKTQTDFPGDRPMRDDPVANLLKRLKNDQSPYAIDTLASFCRETPAFVLRALVPQ